MKIFTNTVSDSIAYQFERDLDRILKKPDRESIEDVMRLKFQIEFWFRNVSDKGIKDRLLSKIDLVVKIISGDMSSKEPELLHEVLKDYKQSYTAIKYLKSGKDAVIHSAIKQLPFNSIGLDIAIVLALMFDLLRAWDSKVK